MGEWLVSMWGQIWPNLAANVIWVPAAWLHHVLIRRHITRLHESSKKEN
jgi:hypothetical protein